MRKEAFEMKRFLSLLLAVILAFSVFSISGFAAKRKTARERALERYNLVYVNGVLRSTDNYQKINKTLGRFNLYYDKKSGTVVSKNNNGAFFGFDRDMRQNIYFASENSWQRDFGFNAAFDAIAPLLNMHYDALRFKFSYGGKDWLIEAWKGTYGITTGAEVGLYNKPKKRLVGHYDAAQPAERLPVSVSLYDKKTGERILYRPMQKTWWSTGFELGRTELPKNLGMQFSITFPDAGMMNAFIGSIKKNMGITYTTKGTTVTVRWNI